MIKISRGIFIRDLALWIAKTNCLIVSDFHLGYEEALNKQGILFPRFSFKDIMARLRPILVDHFATIVVNGDLKHEFGRISDQEWRETRRLIIALKQASDRLVLVKGNHDTILGPIANDIKIQDYYYKNGVYVCHGHKLPKDKDFEKANCIVIGHEHPAVSLRDKLRTERYKCFLVGRFIDKELIVMPSFNLVSPGTDVTRDKLLSPFLKQSLSNFEVYIVEDKVYRFGKLKGLQEPL